MRDRKYQDLRQVAAEVERQAHQKKDYLVQSIDNEFRFVVPNFTPQFQVGQHGSFPLTDHCQRQVADKLKIPHQYFCRMRDEAPQLLRENVNHWLRGDDKRMIVRTLDGEARAYLSNRYRTMDNFDMLREIIPTMMDTGFKLVQGALTDTRIFMKGVFPNTEFQVRGDTNGRLGTGIMISNSEVGASRVNVEMFLYRFYCMNGMITSVQTDIELHQVHLGKPIGEGQGLREVLSHETLVAEARATFRKVADIVRAATTREVFEPVIQRITYANEKKITGNVQRAVELTGKHFNLTKDETAGVLQAMIEEPNSTQWGLANAVTRYAHSDGVSYDRQVELERLGGRVIDLSERDWELISTAKAA